MARMSAGMGLMVPCVLLLLTSGAVLCNTEVVNGTLGNYIYFNESVSDPGLLLQWHFKGNLIAARFLSAPAVCNSHYTGRCQMYDNGTLRLDNLTSANDGIYRFIVRRPLFSTTVKEVYYELRVYPFLIPPVLTSNDTSNNLIGGTFVSLHCNASGQDVTTYTFYRDGKNICSHVTCWDSYLYFQPITGSDSGSYTCTIQNPVSSNTSNTLYLDVLVPPIDGLSGGAIAGIVIGVLAGVTLIGIAVFFIVRKKNHCGSKKRVSEPGHHLETPENQVYVNVPEQHIYERTLPGAQGKTNQESHYEQLTHKDKSIYSNIESTPGKY